MIVLTIKAMVCLIIVALTIVLIVALAIGISEAAINRKRKATDEYKWKQLAKDMNKANK